MTKKELEIQQEKVNKLQESIDNDRGLIKDLQTQCDNKVKEREEEERKLWAEQKAAASINMNKAINYFALGKFEKGFNLVTFDTLALDTFNAANEYTFKTQPKITAEKLECNVCDAILLHDISLDIVFAELRYKETTELHMGKHAVEFKAPKYTIILYVTAKPYEDE